jgi:hypothetical protein
MSDELKPRKEDAEAYNFAEIDAIEKELIGPVERMRLAKTAWARSLVGDLIRRIANLRAAVKERGEDTKISILRRYVTGQQCSCKDQHGYIGGGWDKERGILQSPGIECRRACPRCIMLHVIDHGADNVALPWETDK